MWHSVFSSWDWFSFFVGAGLVAAVCGSIWTYIEVRDAPHIGEGDLYG